MLVGVELPGPMVCAVCEVCVARVVCALCVLWAATVPGCAGDDGASALARFVDDGQALERARCRCEDCEVGVEAAGCFEDALRPLEAELAQTLGCRADWFATVTRCFEAVQDCDLSERRSCAEPLIMLEELCEPWPDALVEELAECGSTAGRNAAGFVCDDGERIASRFRCDFAAQCADGSDEQGCDVAFRCDDGREIPASWRCDAEPDCADGGDERDCELFQCGDGSELPASWRCDGVEDCPDGADELGC